MAETKNGTRILWGAGSSRTMRANWMLQELELPYEHRPIRSRTGETLTPTESAAVRASVGAGIIWNSPFGPLRFDYAFPLLKQSYDRVQQFRFGGGTKF